jgi:hypothetical protein
VVGGQVGRKEKIWVRKEAEKTNNSGQGDVFQLQLRHPQLVHLLTYLQFSVIKWAKQRPGQNPFDVKSDEAIQI